MLRKFTAVALAISLLAVGSSGILMLVIAKASFTMQMDPVHKLFGIVMLFASVTHALLNRKAIASYFKVQRTWFLSVPLVAILALAYILAIRNRVPNNISEPLNALAAEAEKR